MSAGAVVAISHLVSSYCRMAPGFQNSVEYQTLSEMVDIIERGEPPEAFKTVSETYWRRKYVDDWRRDPYLVTMFEKNKAEVKERPNEFP